MDIRDPEGVDGLSPSTEEPSWLDDAEQGAWRGLVDGAGLLLRVLDEELKTLHNLDFGDYEVLVVLSEAPDRRLRMAELATLLISSRSRLTYRITQLEQRGLVARESVSTDRRGTFAVVTDSGLSSLEVASLTHVAGVRRHLIDVLGSDRFQAVGSAMAIVSANLGGPQ
ncbi:MAG: MarR family transcriptional regulator [Actinomycetia bacterium]|nr:MarR family transcriptional regulator [Actinomycetes bacterium]